MAPIGTLQLQIGSMVSLEDRIVRKSGISAASWHFDNLVAFGYYDGPTEGILQQSGRAYVFRTVAIDTDRDIRVITLSEISTEEFERLIDILVAEVGQPRWPVWVPRWEFSSETAQKRAEDAVNAVYRQGNMVAAALLDDALEKCLAVRDISASKVTEITDWFEFIREKP